MSDDQILWLVGMIVGAFLLGLVVLLVNDWYRFEELAEMNRDYYSSIEPVVPGQPLP